MKIKTLSTLLVLALMGATFSSCSSMSRKADSALSSADRKAASAVLTHEQAMTRAHQVHRVSYSIWLDLDAHHEDFQGRTVIHFEMREKARDHSRELLVDFSGGTIQSLILNGRPMNAEQIQARYNGEKITFPVSDLLSGSNRIEIAYSHPYGTSGRGLHRFQDPVDRQVYLYSDLEPYDAHQIFPCFDQPDLKASYELTVEAPPEWEVVANMLEREVSSVDGRKSWQFPPSPVFSTYVFAIHAGPYRVWKADADGIPMRLFARRSLAKYVDHQEWFDVTRRGLAFFNTYFGLAYPYTKYDQLIVPDFNAGAMENVGAVTFTERYIFRSKVTEARRRGRADTILHEMAHMWFGNLVTMRWWNGLWLNESFATFMAANAVDQATPFKNAWKDFFAGMKQWAYWEDQLVTTHPIEVSVADTANAFSNFDGITYGKGASVLKQLSYFLSDEDFREGLQRYFQKFASRNTALSDFIGMLSEASAQDLTAWQKAWLQTPGVNSVEAVWECDDQKKISKFLLRQGHEAEYSTLRPHKTLVGLYHLDHGVLRVKDLKKDTFAVSYSRAETEVPQAIGLACPALVFPNEMDYDYVKVTLDARSLETARESLARIQDPLTRQMLWHALWEMVRDGKMNPLDYAETVFKNLSQEKDTRIVEKVLGTLAQPSGNFTVQKVLDAEARGTFSSRLEKFTRTQLNTVTAGSDLQLVWFHGFLSAARSPESLHFLALLLSGEKKLKGFKVEQERRWEIVRALARGAAPEAPKRITTELKADGTDMGQKEAISAEASFPAMESKERWFRIITRASTVPEEKEMKLSKLKAAMRRFHLVGQEELSRKFITPYFEALERLSKSETEEYLSDFTDTMYPSLCDPQVVALTDDFLKRNPGLPATVIKNLRIMKQEEERCLKIRNLGSN